MGTLYNHEVKFNSFETKKTFLLHGIEDCHFISFLNKIKNINYYDYDLYLYGGLLEQKKTWDVDLYLTGIFDENKLYEIMKEVCEIGFDMGIVVDIGYSYEKNLQCYCHENKKLINLFSLTEKVPENFSDTMTRFCLCGVKTYNNRPKSIPGKKQGKLCFRNYKIAVESLKKKDLCLGRTKGPIPLCKKGKFNEIFLKSLNDKVSWWEGEYQIGDLKVENLYVLYGIQDPKVKYFLEEISKLEHKDYYDIFLVGGITMKKNTFDIDMLISTKKENIIKNDLFLANLMKQITKIGFYNNILCEIYCQENVYEDNLSYSNNEEYKNTFDSYYFTDKIIRKSKSGEKSFNLGFKKEGHLYKKKFNFPHRKTVEYKKNKVLILPIKIYDGKNFITP